MLNVSKSGNLGLIFLSMVSYPDEIFREDDFGMQVFSKSDEIMKLKQGLDLYSKRQINKNFMKQRATGQLSDFLVQDIEAMKDDPLLEVVDVCKITVADQSKTDGELKESMIMF